MRSARWGLVPSWAKDLKIGHRLINARSETITEKPAFKAAAARRRYLIPADGYCEWEKVDAGKVPHFLHRPGELLAFAGCMGCGRTHSAPRMPLTGGCGPTQSLLIPLLTLSGTSTIVRLWLCPRGSCAHAGLTRP